MHEEKIRGPEDEDETSSSLSLLSHVLMNPSQLWPRLKEAAFIFRRPCLMDDLALSLRLVVMKRRRRRGRGSHAISHLLTEAHHSGSTWFYFSSSSVQREEEEEPYSEPVTSNTGPTQEPPYHFRTLSNTVNINKSHVELQISKKIT
ncbi:hypothetical protein JOQ06_022889 [Pogonophryne albipinna]|uniref:Uncharacterized protein n=1 Tax=Pogonophryne albipinna TaxID=1090488 RepID=A0AAD6A6T0_9TELE|nr:hypothetical protein JOQ06_022889 [Pogonophryne albipinna]